MVRLFQVTSQGNSLWRASIEDPHTGEKKAFANLESCFNYLQDQIKDPDGPSSSRGEGFPQ
jgi:hypothetical protein